MKHYDQNIYKKISTYLLNLTKFLKGKKNSKNHSNVLIRTCTQKCSLQVNKIGKVQRTCIVPDVYECFFDMPDENMSIPCTSGPFPPNCFVLVAQTRKGKPVKSRSDGKIC